MVISVDSNNVAAIFGLVLQLGRFVSILATENGLGDSLVCLSC